MANYLPLKIPHNAKWENISITRSTMERPDNDFPPLVIHEPVPARQGGISLSADLITPTADDAQALNRAAQGMMTCGESYAFIFYSHLFVLTGWTYGPAAPELFQVTATSLASLEDLLSLLPY